MAENNKNPESFKARAARRSSMFQPEMKQRTASIFSYSNDGSQTGFKAVALGPKYMNTYKMSPDRKAVMREVRAVLEKSIRANFAGQKFQSASDEEIIKCSNDEIHLRLKGIVPKRYRFIVSMGLIEIADQDVSVASRMLSNTEHDSFVEFNLKEADFAVTATVFLIYLE
ncbi:Oidioi.mRNA.OKI2018_I69.XSR.g16649.t1.cds [Oikopleura dioica]|uniref:Oidioi.mRNA.OKI2018_I69.XSR.g16649.t1.cds n=1 Tax=Oikopleura dioica TaxID=34765 RepID=A0ABN7SP46_OIKDI|nr:Oidioi.mRNA.OKI2018_I69.XSR.g16649.t1.cds [Oikopleura dioica]